MLILGHRGAAGHLPENTMPSFHKALELGADGFEMDVRITSDSKLVVVHGSVVNGHSVQNSPYADIQALSDGYEIPLFEDFLAAFGAKAFLDIELKAPGFEQEALALIERYCDRARTVIASFHPQTLIKVRQVAPDWQLGFIYNRTQDEEQRHNCPIEVVIPQFRLASRDLISEAHAEGQKVFAWTVNDRQEASRLIDLGVDAIISDYPEMVVELAQSRR
ncbi:MAG: glycerophosphodiester phosphodiesterase [Acidobacteria bacterium]|nr:glycerophosphodiester phosphodiesterase [Acidobacteriota bacterium]